MTSTLQTHLLLLTFVSATCITIVMLIGQPFQLSSPMSAPVGDFFHHVQEFRRQRVAEMCRKHDALSVMEKISWTVKPFQFTILPKHAIAWCRVGKSGTSTWVHILARVLGILRDNNTHVSHAKFFKATKSYLKGNKKLKVVRSLMLDDKKSMQRYRSLMIFRHPIDRLYSAFVNKIQSRILTMKGVNDDVKKKPTWAGFLRVVTESKSLTNTHWAPVSILCNPCMYNFEYFLDLANLTSESEALLEELGLNFVSVIPRNIKNDSVSGAERNRAFYSNLMAPVDPDVLAHLLARFFFDFVLFGYDIDLFYGMVADKMYGRTRLTKVVENNTKAA